MALISKASLLMVPSTYEEGTLYNVLPSGNRAPDNKGGAGYDQTRADFTFDRGSNAAATRIGSDGLIKKYRENLALHSNDFSQSEWSKLTNSTYTLTTETIVDPFGISKAVYKVTLTGSGYITLRQSFTGNTNYMTASVYVKLGSSDFNLTLDQSDGDSQTATANTEWQRLSSTHASGYSFSFIDIALTGDNGDYFYVSSAQMQLGGVATDYLDSGATTAKAGVLIDLPRINYDANGENGALLLEPQRANLIQSTEYIAHGVYGYTLPLTPTLTSGITSPSNEANAYNVTDFVAANTRLDCSTAVSAVSAGTHTYSAYYKGSGSINIALNTTIGGGSGGNEKTITLTDEWVRHEITHTYDATDGGNIRVHIAITRTANNTASVDVAFPQIEAGSYPTSYIPNHGTSGGVTRAADVCDGAGSAESINSTEGVLYAEFAKTSVDSEEGGVYLTKDSSNEIRLSLATNNRINLYVGVGGVNVVYMDNTNYTLTDYNKIAVKYKENDYRVFINGTKVHTDTNASVPQGMNEIKFRTFVGNTKQVAVFNEALSDSELETLTTL